MKRPHDALRLDVQAFITEGETLAGHWPGIGLERLADLQTPPQDGSLADVVWQARGQRLPVAGGEAELWLDLQADTRRVSANAPRRDAAAAQASDAGA